MARRKKRLKPAQQTAAGPRVRRQSRLEPRFLDDLRYWVQVSPRTAAHILELVQLTLRDPFTGKGRPEALKGEEGIWSRRIDHEHRLTVADEHVDFLQARYHYHK